MIRVCVKMNGVYRFDQDMDIALCNESKVMDIGRVLGSLQSLVEVWFK